MLGMSPNGFHTQGRIQGYAFQDCISAGQNSNTSLSGLCQGPLALSKFLICSTGDKRLTGKLYVTELSGNTYLFLWLHWNAQSGYWAQSLRAELLGPALDLERWGQCEQCFVVMGWICPSLHYWEWGTDPSEGTALACMLHSERSWETGLQDKAHRHSSEASILAAGTWGGKGHSYNSEMRIEH